MIFNCHFCQKGMKPMSVNSSFIGPASPQSYECDCPYHPAEVRHSYSSSCDLRWVSIVREFEGNDYELFLMCVDGALPTNTLELGLWGELDKSNPKNIYQVLYQGPIPSDLTPENCTDFIKRILALKAFL